MLDTFMTSTLQNLAFVSQAEVRETDKEGRVRVVLASTHDNESANHLWAVLAIEIDGQLQVGDKVLVTGESPDSCFVTGIIKRQAPRHKAPLVTQKGAYAQVIERDGRETIQIRDQQDSIVFEYDTDKGRATLSVAEGDLCLNAPHGAIKLFSSEGIHCNSLSDVRFDSQSEIHFAVPATASAPESAIKLTPQRMTLSGPKCEIKTQQATLLAKHTKIEGESLNATLARSRVVIERMETIAGRVVQRVKDIFCRVENLQQTQAKTVRTTVSNDYYLTSNHADIQAKDDVKINGNKIHLG